MSAYLRWLRAQLGPHLLPLAYVTAIVRDARGRVLCQRRTDFTAWHGLPGGLAEPGETPEEALRREVREETGLEIQPLRLTGLYASLRYQVNYPNGDQAQQVTACYACAIAGGELRPDGVEIDGLAFYDPDALPPLPPWYADMLTHAAGAAAQPHFDAPEPAPAGNFYPDLMAARRVIGPAPLLWPGGSALVRDERGRVLLQRRADFGRWGWPAGALNTGETPAQTAVRETREETGLEVRPVRLLDLYAGHEVRYPNGDRLFPFGACFECRPCGGDLRPDGEESLAVGFFSPDDLPPLVPGMAERIHRALAEAGPELTPSGGY